MLLQQLLFKNNEDERSLPPLASSPGAAHKTLATGTGRKKANPPLRSKGARLQNLKCPTPRNSLAFSGNLRSWQITNNQKPLRVRILNPKPRVTEQAWLLWGELKRKVVGSPRSHPELPLLWRPHIAARDSSSVC